MAPKSVSVKPKPKPKVAKRVAGKDVGEPDAKKTRLDTSGGDKHCDLCKRSSQDTLQKHQREGVIQGIDAPWALYCQPAGGGTKQAQGNQCHECFELWEQGFKHLKWEDLIKQSKDDQHLSTLLNKARSVKAGHATKEGPPQQVLETKAVYLEVERSVVIMSEREIRKQAKVSRIPRASLKCLPSVNILADDGKTSECVYLFHDEAAPYRKAKLKTVCGTVLQNFAMETKDGLYSGQGENIHGHVAGKLGEETGHLRFMDREAQGHVSLTSWEDWLQKKLVRGDGADDTRDGEEEEEDEKPEQHLVLVGPAAAAASSAAAATASDKPSRPAALTTPVSKVRSSPNSLIRSGSATSICDGTPILAAPTEQCNKSNYAGGTSCGDEAEMEDEGERGADALAYWKEKIPMVNVLDGSQDKRSFTGLKRAATRKQGKPETELEASLLHQYHRQVLSAATVAPKSFPTCPQQDVMAVCDMLVAEQIPLPDHLKYNILMRHVARLLAERKYSSLIVTLNPWSAAEEFNHHAPTLAGLAAEPTKKFSIYKKIMAVELLAKLVIKGEEEKDSCMMICRECMQEADKVDLVTVDTSTAYALDELTCMWKALYAISSCTLEPGFEDISGLHPMSDLYKHGYNSCQRPKTCSVLILPPPKCQEHVQRLKRCMSIGAGKSMLANIGASLQGSPYFERRLDEYLLQCPVMVQYGPILKQMLRDMSNFEGKAGETEKLCDMAQQLPKMVHQLRTGSCVELLETFKTKLTENFDQMAADLDT
eukprot:1878449-Amphidinium_carterae.1